MASAVNGSISVDSASASASTSRFACSSDKIDILSLFNSEPRRISEAAGATSSSFSARQQITLQLGGASYNVNLSVNENGKSEICFNAAAKLHPTPESWKFVNSASVGAQTWGCCFSADSKYFITVGDDDTSMYPDGSCGYDSEEDRKHGIVRNIFKVRIWNPSTLSLVATLPHYSSHLVISFHLNGGIMLASDAHETISIWELKEPASESHFVAELKAGCPIRDLIYCKRHNTLISGQDNNTIKFWSASDWQCASTLTPSSRVTALSLSPDESKLASGHDDGSIHLWDVASRTETKSWKVTKNHVTRNGLFFLPSQPNILLAEASNGIWTTWDCATGCQLGTKFSADHLSLSSFSPNGQYLAALSRSQAEQVVFVDPKTNNIIRTLDGFSYWHGYDVYTSLDHAISSTCFSPDGKYFAAATRQLDCPFHLWKSPRGIADNIVPRAVIPEPASDFRLVSLSESACLVVCRLDYGRWALNILETFPESMTLNAWTIISSAIRHPVVRFITLDGRTLAVEDKNPLSTPATPLLSSVGFEDYDPSSYPAEPIDIIRLFQPSPVSESSSANKVTLSSVSYEVSLSDNNLHGKFSEMWFKAAATGPLPESWQLIGSASVGIHNKLYSCFSADSNYFVTAGGPYGNSADESASSSNLEGSNCDYNIHLWDPATQSLAATLIGHTDRVHSLTSFVLAGRIMLASGSDDETIRIWELNQPASSSLCVSTLKEGTNVECLAFCLKHNLLISGHRDNTIKLWSASDWRCTHTLSSPKPSFVSSLSVSSNGSKLASGHEDGYIRIWDMASRNQLQTMEAAADTISIVGLSFSPIEPDILVAVAQDGTCTTWNSSTGLEIKNLPSQRSYVAPCSFSRNGSYFAIASRSQHLILVDVNTNDVARTMEKSPSNTWVSSASFSPNGRYLAAASSAEIEEPGFFRLWKSAFSLAQGSYSIISQIAAFTEAASDFRIILLSRSMCLVVVRLVSGRWAFTVAESTAATITLKDWTFAPCSVRHPVVRFVGQLIQVQDKSPLQAFAASGSLFANQDADPIVAAYSRTADVISSASKDLVMQATLAKQETANLQSFLMNQAMNLDTVLLELSFGKLSDAASIFAKCRSILKDHLSASMSELRSIHSSSSPVTLIPKSILKLPSASSSIEREAEVIDWNSLWIGKEIGKAALGSVLACKLRLVDGQKRPVALKILANQSTLPLHQREEQIASDLPSSTFQGVLKSVQNEIVTSKRIGHPNIKWKEYPPSGGEMGNGFE